MNVPTDMTCYIGDPHHGRVKACALAEALRAVEDPAKHVWINFLDPDESGIDEVVAKLGFHELAVEDVFSRKSRAKIEEFQGHLFCVTPALNPAPGADALDIINLNLFLGRNYLITVQRAALPVIDRLRRAMEGGEPRLLRGADFIFHQLLDGLVDEYLEVVEGISGEIDELEERLFVRFDPTISSSIFALKHRTAWVRRRITPQRPIVAALAHRPHELICAETQVYFRDVEDHLNRISDNLDTFHDLLQGALDVHLALAASRTNQQIKLLSVLSVVLLPMNLLIGLYGTNFKMLPGSGHPLGFWFFCASVAVVGVSAMILFRLRKWF